MKKVRHLTKCFGLCLIQRIENAPIITCFRARAPGGAGNSYPRCIEFDVRKKESSIAS
jgi:hypothetical protein